jgi:hypothetical protein
MNFRFHLIKILFHSFNYDSYFGSNYYFKLYPLIHFIYFILIVSIISNLFKTLNLFLNTFSLNYNRNYFHLQLIEYH